MQDLSLVIIKMEYFADLHVHIGRAKNKPIKITASRSLTLQNIYDYCINNKGIDIVGVVDCASPYVLDEIAEQVECGLLTILPGGGLRYKNKLTVILGAEVETTEKQGAAHSIAFFPYYEQIKEFSKVLSKYITNITLSCQKAKLSADNLAEIVYELGGKLIPAHAFTPFKSFYGSCYDRLSLAFEKHFNSIAAVELGLSADTDFADTIDELSEKTFITNSDAHSLEKIAREYNKLNLQFPDFENIFSAINRLNDNAIIANYGLNPKLGKYHRTFCKKCNYIASEEPPIIICPKCGSKEVTLGVLDRINMISDFKNAIHPAHRPPYYYQIPLEFIPGIGAKTIKELVAKFGTEINVLQNASFNQLAQVIGEVRANSIIAARNQNLILRAGGGGLYGKVEATIWKTF